jgi:hypothetical protein
MLLDLGDVAPESSIAFIQHLFLVTARGRAVHAGAVAAFPRDSEEVIRGEVIRFEQ